LPLSFSHLIPYHYRNAETHMPNIYFD
jgi:hypothetical protein